MNDPVDLNVLRQMTDGDAALEQELFAEFFTSFEAGIAALKRLTDPAHQEDWRKQAHALKGMAVNLGAMALGAVCKQAQEQYGADAAAKTALLGEIEAHYAAAHDFLAA